MTDNETIKAWKICCGRKSISDCLECPYRKIENCLDTVLKDSFTLFNKQRAEVSVLSVENANIKIRCGELEAEIERLMIGFNSQNARLGMFRNKYCGLISFVYEFIDNLKAFEADLQKIKKEKG